MSLSDCKSVILTTEGKDLPLNHAFRGIVDKTMNNILRCGVLLKHHAGNTLQSPSFDDRDRRARVREIRQYLKKYPPTINLLSLERDLRAQAQTGPTSHRAYWNFSNHPNRQSSVCHIEVNKGLVDALNESKDNDDIFRMLSAITIITIIHEIAHVIHVTFTKMPTPICTAGHRSIQQAYTRSKIYAMREAGDSAENIISGKKGEF
ncbi:hypothetical protein BDR07DRAFT_427673 [Suillus spraguei]|nr:hypothetical protein BDR07DRAFT_427673 [Suillus spraguei]